MMLQTQLLRQTLKAIYGMPVLDVENVNQFICKEVYPRICRIDNDLFYKENTLMLFADAKKMTEDITKNYNKFLMSTKYFVILQI